MCTLSTEFVLKTSDVLEEAFGRKLQKIKTEFWVLKVELLDLTRS